MGDYSPPNTLGGKGYRYIIPVEEPPLTITVGGNDYVAHDFILFGLEILTSGNYQARYENNCWVIGAPSGNTTHEVRMPSGWNFVTELPAGGIRGENGECYVLESYRNDVFNAFDDHGMREIVIKDYSRDVITLDGFCAGTYYYTGEE
jgi:hypothetical protein